MKYDFILGVGAQKAGTTWLYNYLKSSKETNLGPVKEWHIWDAIYNNFFSNFLLSKNASENNIINKIRFAMQNKEGFYEKYFLTLVSSEIKLTGDITPSYSTLNCSYLNKIKNKLISSGFNVKVIFIMRDPVLRNWSALRMIIDLNEKYKNIDTNDANELFIKYYQSNGFKLRTNYEFTVENLIKVFEKKNIYFGFYESLFDDTNIEIMSNFLGVKTDLNFKKNYSNRSSYFSLKPNIAIQCRDFYQETYNYCYNKFPMTKKLWENYE